MGRFSSVVRVRWRCTASSNSSAGPDLGRRAACAGTLFAALIMLLAQRSASAQDPLKLLPNNYKLTFNNLKYRSSARTTARMRSCPCTTTPAFRRSSCISTTPGRCGSITPNRAKRLTPSRVRRPPLALTGSPGGIVERHSIENLSATPSDFLRIELKHVSLDLKEPSAARLRSRLRRTPTLPSSPRPDSTSSASSARSPPPCRIKPDAAPSLVVELPSGTVRWLKPSDQVSVPGPAQLLRILLPK